MGPQAGGWKLLVVVQKNWKVPQGGSCGGSSFSLDWPLGPQPCSGTWERRRQGKWQWDNGGPYHAPAVFSELRWMGLGFFCYWFWQEVTRIGTLGLHLQPASWGSLSHSLVGPCTPKHI